MNTILFKSLALLTIGTAVPTTAVATYQINYHSLNTIKKHQPVGFANNNPVFVRSQHDSQGADTVTLSNVNSSGFVLNYTLSEASVAYFYPGIARLAQPGDRLFDLLTKGSTWFPTTHYWQPLKNNDAFTSFITPQLYVNYILHFNYQLNNQFSWSANLTPSYNMSLLQKAMDTGSGFDIRAQVITDGDNVDSVSLTTSVVPNHYPSSAQTQGTDTVFGNMNEPNNVLKVNISATSCQAIHNEYSDFSSFMGWLFNNNGYKASYTLGQYINNDDRTKGVKYDESTKQAVNYWTTGNYQATQATIQAQFSNIMTAVNSNLNQKGITLLFSRDQAGAVSLTVESQLPPFRIAYGNDHKFVPGDNIDFIYLTVQEEEAFRIASFSYLTPDAAITMQAYEYARDWLFDWGSPWPFASIVHPWVFGSQVNDWIYWAQGLWNWDWKAVDQFMAEAIIQNRGVFLELHISFYPVYKTYINFYGQNAISTKS